jgi:hypothetical protein
VPTTPEKQRVRTARHYAENKQYYIDKAKRSLAKQMAIVNERKACPCTDCGVEYPSYVMEFDHRPGTVKVAAVAVLARTASLAKVLAEIAKCDVVCSNCHRERTHQRRMAS